MMKSVQMNHYSTGFSEYNTILVAIIGLPDQEKDCPFSFSVILILL